jgi:hypothetical protein
MQKRQNWFQEAKTRFGMQVPWFFRIVIKIGLACTGFGGVLLGLLALPNFQSGLPLAVIGSNLCIIGAGSAFLAKFVVTTPQDLPNNKPNDIPKDVQIDNQN